MAKGANHVPQFGSWHTNDGVPFTAVFDQARAGKGGKMINPNDPLENPLGHQDSQEHPRITLHDAPAISHPRSPHRKPSGPVPDGNQRPERSVHNAHVGSFNPSADLLRRTQANQVYGSERGSQHLRNQSNHDRSPLHAQASQGRYGAQVGSASPAWERKISADSGSATPGRSRVQGSIRASPQSDSTSLPKFGAWDANDPASADNFTVLFERARVERKSEGIGMHSSTPNRYDEDLIKPSHHSHKRWCCCFQPNHVDA